MAIALAIVLCAAPGWADQGGAGDDEPRNWKIMRDRMLERQIEARGIRNPRVLAAMRRVERHRFVPDSLANQAYEDHPLPIGEQQTISQPFIVAAMTEALDPQPGDRVLEVGTGSGYQAAVLAELVEQVFSIEIIETLARQAKKVLAANGYENVQVIVGDGYAGLPEEAPFDGIIVTAAPGKVPPPLLEQLAIGAHLVIPVGEAWQELRVFTRTESGLESKTLMPVRFVPMTGKAEE
ncbi:MAG: protein-L-isoaspartate(D-aspartate) O-methyltransferase [Deltaproteobacteria bacterium]|jgi:protein-L-isoaspartate(D-aspartate) O-methyltransferase|nr:protein-L-isoaspartate(D-aspartate) O-methyltransferase [Deltaproteobacteria bacterium]MBW2695832.1 protein-L-isoaspartate(D-aspartate) O-methyltransferase [Deltaproteobacteria bacterium]